jgi:glucose/arabinose dehydrogenase/mono/diheme cytochrome c family protein
MFRILRYPFFLFLLIGFAGCAGNKKTKISRATAVATNGKDLFTTNCVSCHALQDDGIGPPIGGITRLLPKDVLTNFINNPGKFIEAGDELAVSLSRRYKLIMPPFDFLKEEEINAILTYIEDETELHDIKPLVVKKEENADPRLAAPVTKSGLRIELEDFVQIPASSDKMPRTRIATMRPHPSADGTLYVSDQRGVIQRIKNGEVNTFLDIKPLVENYINEPGLGTGLGSFSFHPDYLNNGLIYITHTESFKGKKADYEYADSVKVFLQWVVSEWKNTDVKSPVFRGERRELLRINVPGNVHGTQDIGFVPGLPKSDKDYGMLYIGTGDGGSTIGKHPELCHSKHSLLGTIIRIDPLGNNSTNGKYGIPADNPFVNDADPLVRKEIFAYGFRNPHRMSWHGRDGKTMFSTEVGESNFEEINIIQKGGDYGWNVQEGNYGISPKDLKNVYKLPDAETGKTIKPFALYDHIDGNAISGGYVYEGKIAALKDKYIFGDIVNGRIFYVNINEAMSDSAIHEISIFQDGKETSLRKMSGSERVDVRIEYDRFTKEMYVMTKSDGRIRRITKAGFAGNP